MPRQYFPLKDSLEKYTSLSLNYKLPICLGVDEKGNKHFADLTDLGHILMAGSTGSGKSVFNCCVISSLIAIHSSNELKFYLADPKRVELPLFNGIPYLISPVEVEVDKCLEGLEKVAKEKNRRLESLAKFPNQKFQYLVIIIDTFSDLVMYSPERFEKIIKNLTTDASKVGINLLMCDSRPSPDVYTEAIKKCFPIKIAFNTSSPIDSKVILGQSGAEKLLGCGDLLLQRDGQTKLLHLQAPYISDKEIHQLVDDLKIKSDEVSGFTKDGQNPLLCKAFIIDLFTKRYMLHIWFRPYFSIGWHRKRDGLVGKLFWVERYN